MPTRGAGSTTMGLEAPVGPAVMSANVSTRRTPGSGNVVEFYTPEYSTAVTAQVPAVLSADDTALVAEMTALQLLGENTDLELSARQWSSLAQITLRMQAIRQAYEASIATATPQGSGRFHLEIPAYAGAGDALRAKFHEALRQDLGDSNAAQIIACLGARLEGHFAGFGISVQTLDIAITSPEPGAAADYAVTRTVRFWNSVEGQDRLSTRRETHFPRLEDPTGETWTPFLALIVDGTPARRGT